MPVGADDANGTEDSVGAVCEADGLCVCPLPPLDDTYTCYCAYSRQSTLAADMADDTPS